LLLSPAQLFMTIRWV